MAYAVARTDKMTGTKMGQYLVSGKFMEEDTEAAVENGTIVEIGSHEAFENFLGQAEGLEGTKREVRAVTAAEEGEIGKCIGVESDGFRKWYVIEVGADVPADLGIVVAPEVVKDKDHYDLSDFINAAGDLVRVYRLAPYDEFSVTAEGFATVPAFGDAVKVTDGGKLTKAE